MAVADPEYRLPVGCSQVILAAMRSIHGNGGRPALDETDKAIIRHLQEDGRMSYADLAPLIGLSPAATRQRVRHLVDSGVMQIVAVTDPTKLGFDIQAMVGFRVGGDLDQVATTMREMPEVDYLVITTGRFDLLAEIVATSSEDFLATLNTIRSLDGVQSSEVFTYLRLEKQSYDWGVH
jgi:Lrp/AsnC family transcriptional regulator, regulator for asnA, asnC and gidA